jgi:iron complex outermembrane receptor protein
VNGHETYAKMMLGGRMESSLTEKLMNHLVVYGGWNDPYESRPFNILDDLTWLAGVREYLEWEGSHFSLAAGGEFFHEWYAWQIYETLDGEAGEKRGDFEETRKFFNLFSQIQWRPASRILVDGGINLNLLQYNLDVLLAPGMTDPEEQYRYDPVWSPRVGISYQLQKSHALFLAAGHGFSAPTLEETLLPGGQVNTELRPESGWNLDGGLRGALAANHFTYDLSLYTIFLNDLLVTERIAEDQFMGINAGKARNSGFEAWARYRLHPDSGPKRTDLSADLSYTWSVNRFIEFVHDGNDFSGRNLPGIPAHMLSSKITGSLLNWQATIQTSYSGRQWMNDANTLDYGGHFLVHTFLIWKFSPPWLPFGMELTGGVKNIFNADFASMILVNAPSFGANPPRYYYPGWPRQFHAGIRFLIPRIGK